MRNQRRIQSPKVTATGLVETPSSRHRIAIRADMRDEHADRRRLKPQFQLRSRLANFDMRSEYASTDLIETSGYMPTARARAVYVEQETVLCNSVSFELHTRFFYALKSHGF